MTLIGPRPQLVRDMVFMTDIKCADKFAVRGYIEEKGYAQLLVPLIGHWENAEKIDWSKLPDKFVMKCNHGCAYNILCNDKKKFDTNHVLWNIIEVCQAGADK